MKCWLVKFAMADVLRSLATVADRLWVCWLRRALWLTFLGVLVSSLRLSFAESGDMMDLMLDETNGSENVTIFPPCPINASCDDLPGRCINCSLDPACVYGKEETVMCTAMEGVECQVKCSSDYTHTHTHTWFSNTWRQLGIVKWPHCSKKAATHFLIKSRTCHLLDMVLKAKLPHFVKLAHFMRPQTWQPLSLTLDFHLAESLVSQYTLQSKMH